MEEEKGDGAAAKAVGASGSGDFTFGEKRKRIPKDKSSSSDSRKRPTWATKDYAFDKRNNRWRIKPRHKDAEKNPHLYYFDHYRWKYAKKGGGFITYDICSKGLKVLAREELDERLPCGVQLEQRAQFVQVRIPPPTAHTPHPQKNSHVHTYTKPLDTHTSLIPFLSLYITSTSTLVQLPSRGELSATIVGAQHSSLRWESDCWSAKTWPT